SGARPRAALPACRAAYRVGRARGRLALPPLQGRGPDHRRRGRRNPGDARRAARAADPPPDVSRALAGAERADRAGEARVVVAFEELKARQAVAWSDGRWDQAVEELAPMHDHLAARLEPRPGERWLDVGTGTGAIALRAARARATVVGLDLAPGMIEA